MKVLNLYSGIGGNRTHWVDCHVTAVEINSTIAEFYRKRFPDDTVVVGDAHEYLRTEFERFDFIWSSVPCQSHSRARFWNGKLKPVYPDMKLYEEIVFLKSFFKGDWLVENVTPYYDPLITATRKLGRHLVWSNRQLPMLLDLPELDVEGGKRSDWETSLGIELGDHKFDQRTDQILRNCVHPETGKQLFEYFQGIERETQATLFV